MSDALAPPKPKELVNAYSNRALAGWVGTGNAQRGSGCRRVVHGGSHWPRSAIRHTTASTAPAAPKRWPMLALVELTGRWATASPAQALIALASALSLSGVPVPWALTYPTCAGFTDASAQAARIEVSAANPWGCGWVR